MHSKTQLTVVGILFGCLFPLAGTLLEAGRLDMLTLNGMIQLQQQTPLLWIIDSAPLILGLAGRLIGTDSETRMGREGRLVPVLLTGLLLPLILLLFAVVINFHDTRLVSDTNLSGSLRYKSLYIYAITHGEKPVRAGDTWPAVLRNMQEIRGDLHSRYPRIVGESDSAWRKFDEELRTQHRISWDTAEIMREAADQQTQKLDHLATRSKWLLLGLSTLDFLCVTVLFLVGYNLLRELVLSRTRQDESEYRFRKLSEATFEGIALSQNGIVLTVNDQFCRMFGYEQAEVVGQKGELFVVPEQREIVREHLMAGIEKPYETVGLCKDGSHIPILVEGKTVTLKGKPARVTALRDVSDRIKAEADRRRFTAVLESTADFVGFANAHGRPIYINPAGRRMVGLAPEEDPAVLTIAEVHSPESAKKVLEEALPCAIESGSWTGETELMDRSGKITPVLQLIHAHRGPDSSLEFFSTLGRDISDRKRYEAQLKESNDRLEVLATTDELTRLHNRRAFNQQLKKEIDRALRYETALSLIMLDIDRFKQVNDSWGHDHGDVVLVRVADILRETLRPSDYPARIGGEEMAVILPNTNASGALATAERCRAAIEEASWPKVNVTVSIGVATFSLRLKTSESLLKAADTALYTSKTTGRNRCTQAVDSDDGPVSP